MKLLLTYYFLRLLVFYYYIDFIIEISLLYDVGKSLFQI